METFRLESIQGMYSFRQLMTADMPTIVARNIIVQRPTHDCSTHLPT